MIFSLNFPCTKRDPSSRSMSLFQSSSPCGDEPITAIVFWLRADGQGFARSPQVICGGQEGRETRPGDRIQQAVSHSGFRGFETWQDPVSGNVMRVVLWPNDGGEPIDIRASDKPATGWQRSAKIVRPLGYPAHTISFAVNATPIKGKSVGRSQSSSSHALKAFRLDFAQPRSSASSSSSRFRSLQNTWNSWSTTEQVGSVALGMMLLAFAWYVWNAARNRQAESNVNPASQYEQLIS